MLIVAAFALGVIVLRLGGCDLGRLNDLRLRRWPLALVALGVQSAIIFVWPTGWRSAHLTINLGTYAAIGAFLWVNRHIAWLWVVALGTVCNTAAMAANGGVMPASPRAISMTHLPTPTGFANSAAVAHPRLLLLGDIFPTPPWLPLHNVASIGDFLILGGALLLVAHHTDDRPAMAWPWAASRPG